MIYRSMTLKGCTIPNFKLNGIILHVVASYKYTNVNHCPKFYDDIFAAMSSVSDTVFDKCHNANRLTGDY